MIFHFEIFVVVFLTVFINLMPQVFCSRMDYVNERNFNRTVFLFEDIKNCAKNEFYDLNYFQCYSCKIYGENMQMAKDEFSCGCISSSPLMSLTIYDGTKSSISCRNICHQELKKGRVNNTTIQLFDLYCQSNETVLPKQNCKFKYINRTMIATPAQLHRDVSRRIEITEANWQYDGLCNECNIQYNFHYQDYCIANSLLRPYLSYNSFWQQATTNAHHFGELKFVAFFCMALKNQTACNQLANLCVLSHFASDKNSPCNKFLLNQATDLVNRYGSVEDLVAQQQTKPFLYFSKGKESLAELTQPIKGLKYSANTKNTIKNHLKFFANTYALDGTLLRWGSFKLIDLNLCSHFKNSWNSLDTFKFAFKYEAIKCSLLLEDLIDLAKIYGNDRFTTLFLNYTRSDDNDGIFLQTIPILIEDITPENKHPQKEDWQLVKRFQLLQFYPRHSISSAKAPPRYEDSHKLQLFRSMRYTDKIELHYDIYDENSISIPILKLHYRHIEFTNNTTLKTNYNFIMHITFQRVGETAKGELVNEIALPIFLVLAVTKALLKAYNIRKRRSSSFCATTTSSTPLTASSTSSSSLSQNNNEDFCHFIFFTEFLLNLISYMAVVFLICFLLHVFISSLSFLSQDNVELTVPIVKDPSSLALIIYAALILKLIFIGIYFWRLTHFHIFLIDWERPRCGDTQHFNLKNNLETSSVCSSVRTFISDANVSAWRCIFLANEWIQLSGKQKTSKVFQGLTVLLVSEWLDIDSLSHDDKTIKIFYISLLYILIYSCQYFVLSQILTRITGNSIHKYIEHCSLANVSVFTLIEPSFGFYIHGRSPHGFADSDMSTMIMQLQRETQSICGRRGLLSDTDQCYVILPPRNLSNYFDKLLLPYQKLFNGAVAGGGVATSGGHFPKEINNIEGTLEKTSMAYCSVNRFFCAFIDHGIKDMDYIIKEKTIIERLLGCEFENYLTDNKGTFYIDNCYSFTQLLLYGNEFQLFVLEFLLLLAIYLIFSHLLAAVIVVCISNKILQALYRFAVRENISNKTLIDKRFLM